MSFISLTGDDAPDETISSLYEKLYYQEDNGREFNDILNMSLGTQLNEGFKRRRHASEWIDFLGGNDAQNRSFMKSKGDVPPPTLLKIPQMSAPIHDKSGYKVLFSTSKSNKRTFSSINECMQTSPKDLGHEKIPIQNANPTYTNSSSVQILGSRTSPQIEKVFVSNRNSHVFQHAPRILHVFEPVRKASGADIGHKAHISGQLSDFTHYSKNEESGGQWRGDFTTESINEDRVAMPPQSYVRSASQKSETISACKSSTMEPFLSNVTEVRSTVSYKDLQSSTIDLMSPPARDQNYLEHKSDGTLASSVQDNGSYFENHYNMSDDSGTSIGKVRYSGICDSATKTTFLGQDVRDVDENELEEEDEDEDEDDSPCAVCGVPDSLDDDPIIFCDGVCTLCVHQSCYGLAVVPKDEFFCEQCEHGAKYGRKPSPTCVLCSRTGGVMKLSTCGQWAHIVCVMYTSELELNDEMRLGNLWDVKPERAELRCRECKGVGGAVVQCWRSGCLVPAHPYCAQCSNWKFVQREYFNDEERKICLSNEIFCLDHSFSFPRTGVVFESLDNVFSTRRASRIQANTSPVSGLKALAQTVTGPKTALFDTPCSFDGEFSVPSGSLKRVRRKRLRKRKYLKDEMNLNEVKDKKAKHIISKETIKEVRSFFDTEVRVKKGDSDSSSDGNQDDEGGSSNEYCLDDSFVNDQTLTQASPVGALTQMAMYHTLHRQFMESPSPDLLERPAFTRKERDAEYARRRGRREES